MTAAPTTPATPMFARLEPAALLEVAAAAPVLVEDPLVLLGFDLCNKMLVTRQIGGH